MELTLTDTVVDEDDQPLAGVSVTLSCDEQEEVMTAAGAAFAVDLTDSALDDSRNTFKVS